ncbi:hypothetical protein EJ05DRAFT_540795 [Pseudovirgaria hyperparasitica]|uniref:Uncharacterized protein n=1 Tax=Pseudovirgaria hyperparasitica TaxID=470096 RepID=A0A6A6VZH2_9PEZI|nr:uncharacterized protein EJ05DRAFT_540795 [Pseudovirgaria hyperparasitica]KAF2754717.1 hypothetical protein EJ05DRAFT_540795 [Pseudovirgaria hyperparasitica]
MHDEPSDPHHLLAQLPLTVSPFLSLPSATTLPYTYKSLPSTLPPSALDTHSSSNDPATLNSSQESQKPAYVMSAGGHSAHPDDIISNCRALQAHLDKLEKDAKDMVKAWDDRIRERELAEKRRVAPGWLDEDVKMLVPEKKSGALDQGLESGSQQNMAGNVMSFTNGPLQQQQHQQSSREGEELDRAFGGLDIRR